MASTYDFRLPSSSPPAHLGTETVAVTTLDAFLRDQGISSVDFMKMDIEGSEYTVLEGGLAALKAGVIRAWSFEFGQCNIASRTYLLDFWYVMNRLSYHLNLIGPKGSLIPVPDYSPRYEVLRHSNFIAVYSPGGVRPTSYHR